jgi:hypothetical protein
MRDLNYQLKQLCKRNRDGSYSTQANRARILNQIANQLQEMGYRRMTTRSLKPKHVDALVKRWFSEGMAAGTIKNRMNCLRWWAAKVDRRNVIARSNEFYGIPDRQFVSQHSKAVVVGNDALTSVKDEHVRMTLELQRAIDRVGGAGIDFATAEADNVGDTHAGDALHAVQGQGHGFQFVVFDIGFDLLHDCHSGLVGFAHISGLVGKPVIQCGYNQ